MRKTLIAGALFLSLVCLAGCGGGDGITDGVRMNYSTGRASDKVYDRELFYNNTNETVIADPGVVYVSEEENEEYGGWYYMYGTGSSASYTTGDGNLYAFQCFRSKNLVDWQLAGEYAKGYSLMLTSSDWVNLSSENIWAPEVIYNPTDGKFYMYFSAEAKPSATVSSPSAAFDKLYLGIAVGDTPVSFRPIGAEDALFNAEGELVTSAQPPIDFERAYDCGIFSVIDASPFLDDDGQLYLYFNKHTDSNPKTPSLQGVWGMKMKDFVTPDYSTLTLICSPGVVSAEGGLSADGKPEVMSRGSAYSFSEGSVNEGPFMVKHDGTYYMTYSANGYSSPSYSVHQAISDDPLEGFVKPQTTDGNPRALIEQCLCRRDGASQHCESRRRLHDRLCAHGQPVQLRHGLDPYGRDRRNPVHTKCGRTDGHDFQRSLLYAAASSFGDQRLFKRCQDSADHRFGRRRRGVSQRRNHPVLFFQREQDLFRKGGHADHALVADGSFAFVDHGL